MPAIETATFGNKGGSHQLLESSLPATASVLDVVRFLVDRPAGHIDSGATWSPYWGCGPADDWWVIWCGSEDEDAPRKNMVRARVALIPLAEVGVVPSLAPLLHEFGAADSSAPANVAELGASVIDELAKGRHPAIVSGVGLAPLLLQEVWPRLWATARASLSLRTLFGVESLDKRTSPHIVVVPAELRGRWQDRRFLDAGSGAERSSDGESSRVRQLLDTNADRLPGDFTVLGRIERVASRLDRLHAGLGNSVADALVVARTVDALPFQFLVPEDDMRVLIEGLESIEDAAVSEVRSASLTALDWLDRRKVVEEALERWVVQHLPDQPASDVLWVIAKHSGGDHAEWWRRAISNGLSRGCKLRSSRWGRALWAWWSDRPSSLTEVERYLGTSEACEKWLEEHAPDDADDELLTCVVGLAGQRNWPRLLARVLGRTRPLADALKVLRDATSSPEAGLEVLLDGRAPEEVVEVAAINEWGPLKDSAVALTASRPGLLAGVDNYPGFFGLLRLHMARGGPWPAQLMSGTFFTRLFDEALAGQSDALALVGHLDASAGALTLDYPRQDALWNAISPVVNDEFIQGAADEWWRRFLENEGADPPGAVLRSRVLQSMLTRVRGASITLVISLLRLFPEIGEGQFQRWITDQGFRWAAGDHQRLGELLVERRWREATGILRWSRRRELKIVAWHARELLPWYDRFWSPPEGASTNAVNIGTTPSEISMRVTFLASNPMVTDRLALAEEARAIEQKVRDSRHRDAIQVRMRWATRPEDLQQILLEDEPTVVHFSGHGRGTAGIVLHAASEDDKRLLDSSVLADLFRVHKRNIRVVVLNACYSEVQAQAVVQEIDFVVGMSDPIGDEAARVFAAAFYRGLGFGRSVQEAFDQGVLELKLLDLDEDVDIPSLLVRSGVDASSESLVRGG